MRVFKWVLTSLSIWLVLLMSDRVPRKSTVEKSRLLQEKLEATAKAKEIRSLQLSKVKKRKCHQFFICGPGAEIWPFYLLKLRK